MYVYSAASVLYASDRNRRCSGYLYEKLRSERGEKNKKNAPDTAAALSRGSSSPGRESSPLQTSAATAIL